VAESAWAPTLAPAAESQPRHSAIVRTTHWITALCFLALLISGIEIVISHPRFYWGEDGNVLTPPLFQLPIPASRSAVPTGYGFVLDDQNGWSRSLHFQSAWIVVFTGLLYVLAGLFSGHFRRNLVPSGSSFAWPTLARSIADHLSLKRPATTDSYNVLQRLAYLTVVFALFPLMLWTGLAMSPAITSAFPSIVTVLGGQQSARTIHFLVTVLLVLFVLVHILMVCLAGFASRTRAMITGRCTAKEHL
jgi:thiosulfate reductase cytochrome b subunit